MCLGVWGGKAKGSGRVGRRGSGAGNLQTACPAGPVRGHAPRPHDWVSTPLDDATPRPRRGSASVAVRRARANALNVASTMWWELVPASCTGREGGRGLVGRDGGRAGSERAVRARPKTNPTSLSTLCLSNVEGHTRRVDQGLEKVFDELGVVRADALGGDGEVAREVGAAGQVQHHVYQGLVQRGCKVTETVDAPPVAKGLGQGGPQGQADVLVGVVVVDPRVTRGLDRQVEQAM